MIRIVVKDFGTMEAELDWKAAPNSCANFVALARKGFYEGLIFHRIIPGFMIQGGWLELKDNQLIPHETEFTIKGEFSSNGVENPLKHVRGVLSMARTNDPNSSSSQFFIMHKDSPFLDGQYAAFGHLTSGFDVLDKIANVETYTLGGGLADFPAEIPVIEKVEVVDEPEAEVEPYQAGK